MRQYKHERVSKCSHKHNRMISLMGVVLLCSVPLLNASSALAIEEKTSTVQQTNTQDSSSSNAELPTLPSEEVKKDPAVPTDSTNLDESEKPAPPSSSVEVPSTTTDSSLSSEEVTSSVPQTNNDSLEDNQAQTPAETNDTIESRAKEYREGDWGFIGNQIVKYYGTDSTLIVPTRNKKTNEKLYIDFEKLVLPPQVSGLNEEKNIKSIRFQENSAPNVVTATGVSGKLTRFSNLVSFNGSNSSLGTPSGSSGVITSLDNFFADLPHLEQVAHISHWFNPNNINKITSINGMFKNCSSLRLVDANEWNVSFVTSMVETFRNCASLASLDLSTWNTSSVNNTHDMFTDCTQLTSIGNTSNWKFPNLYESYWMFYNCPKLESLNVANWDMSNNTDISRMFQGCSSLTELDVSKWNTSKVKYMGSLFQNCSALKSLEISNWDTSNVIKMQYMFYNASSLTSLNISNWNMAKVDDISFMIYHLPLIKQLDLRGNFSMVNPTVMDNFIGEPTDKEMKIFVTPASSLEAKLKDYNFDKAHLIPFKAVILKAGIGYFGGGTNEKIVRYSNVVNPSIDALQSMSIPSANGYTFRGWDKNVSQEPQIWTAQYRNEQITLPGGEGLNTNNTTINTGLVDGKIGIGYVPQYISGKGQFVEYPQSTGYTTGILWMSVSDINGYNKANNMHIGVKDTTQKSNSWNLTAKFSSDMPNSSFLITDPEVKYNNSGVLEELPKPDAVVLEQNNLISGKNISSALASHNYFQLTSTPLTIMKAKVGTVQDGLYDLSSKGQGIKTTNASQVSSGNYTGTINWDLQNVPTGK